MKLAIMSDLHLGKRQYRNEDNRVNKYEQAGYNVFNNYIEEIIKQKPDLVINCGDTFDVPDPSILALSTYINGMNNIKHIPSLCILGNHDFSFKNKLNSCSSLNMANRLCHVVEFAEYEIKTYKQNGKTFILVPYMYGSKEDLSNYWKKVDELVSKEHKPIMITHGCEERYIEGTIIQEPFILPSEITKKCQAVFIGHIHVPFEYYINDCLVCSPGASIDYQANELQTGLRIYDTETGKLEKILIDAPYIIKATCNEDELNKLLENAEEKIYDITFTGDINKVDNDLIISAKQKAINMKITILNDKKEVEEEIKHNTNFIDWVKENYNEYLEDIINAWSIEK